MNILEKIKTKKTYFKKSNMCSGDEFLITITYNKKRISFHFHDNCLNESDKNAFLGALLNDAIAYEYHQTIKDFMDEYGYKDTKEAKTIYDACKKQSERLNKLFNENEQLQLQQELEGWY